ncbi:MAG: hypothetical protein ACLFQU_13225 [Candidatus Kapaibacterium sp.]
MKQARCFRCGDQDTFRDIKQEYEEYKIVRRHLPDLIERIYKLMPKPSPAPSAPVQPATEYETEEYLRVQRGIRQGAGLVSEVISAIRDIANPPKRKARHRKA